MVDSEPADGLAALDDDSLIRRYLLSVLDPEFVFDARQHQLVAELDDAKDVLARLSLHGEIIRRRERWREGLEGEFVRRAGRWARTANANVTDMLALGVPREVLVSAGVLAGGTD